MPGRPTNKGLRNPATIRELERDNEALAMRANGVNLRDIATHFGFNHPQQAARMVDRAMVRVPRENAIKLRAIWDDRHERAAKRALEIIDEDHVAISHGEVVTWDGTPVYDRMPNVAAIRALMDVSKRAAALGGLDAPTRRVVEFADEGSVDRAIAQLEQKLAENDPSPDRSTNSQAPPAG